MKAVYIFSQIARFTASLFSIGAGFIYTQRTVSIIMQNQYSTVITAILLTILEAGTIIFVYSAFRIVLFKRTFPLTYIVPAIGFLSITFILTTNGAVMWLRQETDKKQDIHKELIRDIRHEQDSISELLSINKAIYDSLARAELHKYKTAREMQTEKLRFYSDEIKRLQSVLNDEKNDRKAYADLQIGLAEQKFTDNKNRYWWLAFIIMSAVVYFNFLTAYLEYKRKKEKAGTKTPPPEKNRPVSEKKPEEKNFNTIIAELKASGMSQNKIAKQLGISPSKLSRMINKKQA